MKICVLFLISGVVPALANSVCEGELREIAPAPGGLTLVQLQTPGVDTLVSVSSSKDSFVINNPPSRYGPDFVFLQRKEKDAARIELCIEPVFDVDWPAPTQISYLDVSTSTTQEIVALRQLMQAGQKWHSGQEIEQREAVAIYAKSAGHLPASIAPIAQYYAALGAATLFDLRLAELHLEGISEDDRYPFLKHALLWLEATTRMLNDEDPGRTQRLLLQALTQMDDAFKRDQSFMLALLAETYLAAREVDEGERVLQRALGMAAQDPRGLASVYNDLGFAAIQRSYLAQSEEERIQHLQESVRLHLIAKNHAIDVEDYPAAALVLNNIGWLYLQLGDLVQAQFYLRRSLDAVYDQVSNRSNTLIYNNLGKIYLRFGELLKAEAFLSKAITSNESGESGRISEIMCSIGTLHRERNELDQAIALHQSCRDDADELLRSNPLAKYYEQSANAHLQLSIDLLSMENVKEASEQILQGKHRIVSADHSGQVSPNLQYLDMQLDALQAVTAARLGDSETARSMLSGLVNIDSIRDATVRVEVKAAIFEALRLMGDTKRAVDAGFAVITEVEQLFGILDEESLAPAWANKTHKYYEELVHLLTMDGVGSRESHDLLFNVLERSRAPSLRKSLAGLGLNQRKVDAGKIARLGELANQLAQQQGANSSLERYRTHDAYLSSELNQEAVVHTPDVVTLEQTQAALSSDEVVFYYVLREPSPFVVLIDRDRFEVTQIPIADVAATIASVLGSAMQQQYIEDSAELTHLLPDVAGFPYKKVYFVLHKSLHSLPVSLLKKRDGAYLSELAELAIIPSVSSLLMAKHAFPAHELDLAVIANPVFDPLELASQKTSDEFRSWSNQLARLPWSAKEAESLVDIFDGRKVEVYTGMQATRRNLFREDVRNARLLHIASHGYFAGDSTDNVGLVLTADRGSDEAAFVTITEIMSQQFSNQLVVISGCETARGHQQSGEGSLSISRSFLAQGAENVLATLWPVSDKASARFMSFFYEEVVKGKTYAGALADSQLKMRQIPQYRKPFFWASYTLTSVTRAK